MGPYIGRKVTGSTLERNRKKLMGHEPTTRRSSVPGVSWKQRGLLLPISKLKAQSSTPSAGFAFDRTLRSRGSFYVYMYSINGFFLQHFRGDCFSLSVGFFRANISTDRHSSIFLGSKNVCKKKFKSLKFFF